MAFLNRYWKYAVVAGAAVAASSPNLQAAPVVFGFDATMAEIRGDPAPLNLPFEVAVGQPIKGTLSFRSEQELFKLFTTGDYLGYGGRISFTVGDTEFGGRFNMETRCCYPATDLLNTSEIELWYQHEHDSLPGWPGLVAGHWWYQSLRLKGATRTITAPEQLLNARTWNQLTELRELHLDIGLADRPPGRIRIRATVGDFFLIPEPSTIWLMFVGVVLAIYTARRRTHEI